jgi:multidrug resistance efflux pump
MSLEKATAFDAAVAEAHITELQRQLAEAHATIERLNKRGGYTLEHMINHARRFAALAQRDEARSVAQMSGWSAEEAEEMYP